MGKILVMKDADFSHAALGYDPFGIVISGIVSPSEGGIITGTGNYEEGEEAILEAVSNSGFVFEAWTDGVTTPSRRVVVGSTPATYTAVFSSGAVVPTVDTVVQTSISYNRYIFVATSDETAIPLGQAVISTQYTSQFQIYRADILYSGAVYNVQFKDNLTNSTESDHYKYCAICDNNNNVLAYIFKDVTGTGNRSINIDMSQYPSARFLYVSTNQNVITVIAKAPVTS